MTSNEIRCDESSLLDGLRTMIDGTENPALLEHVEHCAHCQMRLEQLAGNAEDWQLAGEAFSSDNDDQLREEALARTSHWARRPTAWTESMARQLLSPPSHPEMLGRLGRYEVERLIGSGGMGVVFKAFDTELNRPVAIKALAPYLSGNGPARKRFAREARAAAAVVHDHVVPIHNVESEQETPFLVMQYVAGESLQARLDREGPLELCEILRIGRQIASGLSAAHDQGLVHRDIKPSNILLEPTIDRALITDFGLARAADDATITQTGFHPGTPQFMSPEQAAGESVDARSDLFSLGSVLYAMCTGRPPFRAETSLAVLRRIVDDQPRPIQEINPHIPTWLCEIVNKLMAKQAGCRFDSAEQVAEILQGCLAHVQQPTTTPLPALVSQLTQLRSRPSATGRVKKQIAQLLSTLPPLIKYFAAAIFGFSLIFAGVVIVLELDKGTLTIESDVENVPIRITQDDKVVEQLTISTTGKSVRMSAGTYRIEIIGEFPAVTVLGDKVSLARGARESVRITHRPPAARRDSALGSVTVQPEVNADATFDARLRELDDLRKERKPTQAEVDRLVEALATAYPQQLARIHGQATHLYGQSGIQEFSERVIDHGQKAIRFESEPLRRARLYMYLGNATEVSKKLTDATDWYLKGWLELQPLRLPAFAPELPAVGAYRGLAANPGDAQFAQKSEMLRRLAETEQIKRKEAEAVREFVQFRSIFVDALRRLYPDLESQKRLGLRANELFGHGTGSSFNEGRSATDKLLNEIAVDNRQSIDHALSTGIRIGAEQDAVIEWLYRRFGAVPEVHPWMEPRDTLPAVVRAKSGVKKEFGSWAHMTVVVPPQVEGQPYQTVVVYCLFDQSQKLIHRQVFAQNELPESERREKSPAVDSVLKSTNTWLTSALKGDVETAKSVAENRPASESGIKEFSSLIVSREVTLREVWLNEVSNATTALAITEAVDIAERNPNRPKQGHLILSLTTVNSVWRIRDIDFAVADRLVSKVRDFQRDRPFAIRFATNESTKFGPIDHGPIDKQSNFGMFNPIAAPSDVTRIPRPATLRFSATKEVVLSMGTLNFMLDLESGNTCPPPARPLPIAEALRFDLHPLQHRPSDAPDGLMLSHQYQSQFGLAASVVEVETSAWDLSITELLATIPWDKLRRVDRIPTEKLSYYVMTFDGTQALLQVLGAEGMRSEPNESWGVRLRYKTIQLDQSDRASGAIRRVMEYLFAIRCSDEETIRAAFKGNASIDTTTSDMAKLIQSAGIPDVYETGFAQHSAVVALGPMKSSDQKLDGHFLLFTLSLVDERWSIVDIDLETRESLAQEFNRSVQAHLKTDSISSLALPQVDSNMKTPGKKATEFIDLLQGLWRVTGSEANGQPLGESCQVEIRGAELRLHYFAKGKPVGLSSGKFVWPNPDKPEEVDVIWTFDKGPLCLPGRIACDGKTLTLVYGSEVDGKATRPEHLAGGKGKTFILCERLSAQANVETAPALNPNRNNN